MAKSLENQLKDLQKVTDPTDEQMEKIIELEEKIAKKEVKNFINASFHEELSELYFEKLRTKREYWKEDRERTLKKLLDEAKQFDGLIPFRNQTLSTKGRIIKLVEGVPTPIWFTDLLTDAQKKQYFK